MWRLGARREGVIEATGNLQNLNIIHYSRGRSRCWTGRGWNGSGASAMPWSSKETYRLVRSLANR